MSEPLIRMRKLTKNYGEKKALQNVNLQINTGEFVALVGESGGGKSTLLRLLAGLEEVTSGELQYINETPVTRVMFQNDRLLPWMTIAENVAFNKKKGRARALELLAEVGLQEFANDYPSQLSGGQKQRVALARALMANPQLLLLDEPLGALDALTRGQMQELVLKICREQQLTTVLVTHDVEEAVKMAERIIVMKNGTNRYEEFCPTEKNAQANAQVAEKVFNEIVMEEA